MPFVQRNEDGDIIGIFANQQPYASEWVADDTGELLEFMEPKPVTPKASRRQFFQGLAMRGLIAPAEALAAVQSGAIPAAFSSALAGLSDAEQFAAQMLVAGAAEFEPDHPITLKMAGGLGWSEADRTALFTFCATL